MRQMCVLYLPVVLGVLCAPRPALACSVCVGQTDSLLASGVNAGLYLLLAVTGGMFVAFGTFFGQLARRARRVAAEEAASASGRHVAGAGRMVSTGVEGTAC